MSASRGTTPPSRTYELGALEVIARCESVPGGWSEFDVTAANRSDASVGSARLDAYFGKGTRLGIRPGAYDPWTTLRIAGRHAWNSVDSWGPYTGFGVQVAVDGTGSSARHAVVYVLTVHGVRHQFPTWSCSTG